MEAVFKSGSTKLVKTLNKTHVLNLVRLHPKITARKISNITNLQMSTTLYTLRALKEDGFVKEIGFGITTSQGGKPPILWDIDPEYGYVIGLGLISKEVRVVIIKFDGEVAYENKFPIKKYSSTVDVKNQIIEVISNVIDDANIEKEKILGLGIGFSGLVNSKSGVILKSRGFNFENFPLKSLLELEFPFKIEVENNANAGALGIKWLHREAQELPNIIYLSIHKIFNSMGIGLIINHELFYGSHHTAGEGMPFPSKSLWEEYLHEAKEKYDDFNELLNKEDATPEIPITIETVIEMAKKYNQAAIFVLKNAGKEISEKLALQINFLDPDAIYVGGGFCETAEFIAPIIKEKILSNVIAEDGKVIPIRYSPFGIYSIAVGGAALILQKIFARK